MKTEQATRRRGAAGHGPHALGVTRRGLAALALGAWALAGCPAPPDPSGPCAGEGEPELTLTNRGGGTELTDGAEVEVFPPPQGGVFTELDMTIAGLDAQELDELRITIVARDSGRSLADVTYLGDLIPLMCTDDDVLSLEYVPVGFTDPVLLADLDGVAAIITGTLVTAQGDFTVMHEVVLRATDY